MENNIQKELENEKLEQIYENIENDNFNKTKNSLDTENDKPKKQKRNPLQKSLIFFWIIYFLGIFTVLLLQDTLWEYTLILAIWFGYLILILIWLLLFNCIRYLVSFSYRVIKWEKFTPSKWKKITTWEIIGIIILIYIMLNIIVGIIVK